MGQWHGALTGCEGPAAERPAADNAQADRPAPTGNCTGAEKEYSLLIADARYSREQAAAAVEEATPTTKDDITRREGTRQ